MTRRSRLNRRNHKVSVIRKTLGITGLVFGSMILLVMGTLATAVRNLPSLEAQATNRIAQSTYIYDDQDKKITTLHAEQNRVIIPLSKVPENMQKAVIAIEDKRFYQHKGIDYEAIARAIVTDLKSGRIEEGGSTLTQQYVKNTLLTQEKTFNRKIKEAFLAYECERQYSKKKILEKYMNTVYFGNGNYGVETTSQYFFGKHAEKLSLSESALLAGVIRLPYAYSPYIHPEMALKRRNLVLRQMVDQGLATKEDAKRAIEAPIHVREHKEEKKYPGAYFIEYVKSIVMKDKRFGSTEQQRANALFKGGLRIHTTMNVKRQLAADKAVAEVLNLPGDPTASFVAIEPKTGYINAMVGGKDFFGKGEQAKFNIAVQGRRQTGSAFKIFVLTTAMLQGKTPNDTYDTSSITIPIPGSKPWNVHNYEGGGGGRMTIAQGTAKSVNALYARLMMDVGAKNVVKTAHLMGITTPINPNPAIALGGLSKGVSPLEMSVSIATLADGGIKHEPIAIKSVEDSFGKTLLENKPKGKRVLPRDVAATVTSVLEGVIKGGTAVAANIGRPAAGKTGTAQNWQDAWFCGYTPDLVAAVWVGFPKRQIPMTSVHGMRVTGGSFPAEIWHDFMIVAMEGVPFSDFEGITSYGFGESKIRICTASNKLATQYCPSNLVKTEYMLKEDAPTEYCNIHKGESNVPTVVGLSAAEARSAITGRGFKCSVTYGSSSGSEGSVYSQSPSGGSKLSKGGTVTIRVTRASSKSVPNVVGMPEADAKLVLKNAGFNVSVSIVPGEAGKVMGQSPTGKAKAGSTVTISVGDGTI